MFKIVKVSYIAKGKKSGMSHVVLHLSNSKVIVRRVKQMLTDLADSFLISSADLPITSSQVRKAMKDLIGGAVSGDIRFYKKGEQYTLNENSKAVIAGTAKAGDVATHESDGAWIEGFLTLELSDRADRNQRIADSYAEMLKEFAVATPDPSNEEEEEEEGVEEVAEGVEEPVSKKTKM
jgi:hypothetical protein